jgi:hypothetical protein
MHQIDVILFLHHHVEWDNLGIFSKQQKIIYYGRELFSKLNIHLAITKEFTLTLL